MERIIWMHQSEHPFYVFDEKHIVHFWDDGVSIHRASPWYRDADTRLSPFDGPHVYPKALPLQFYKNVVLNERLPISLTMEGESLGTIKRTSGYVQGESELGAYRRRIIRQRTQLSVADGCLLFNLDVEASPVDPKTVLGTLGDEDRSPRSYGFAFRFALDLVPELLNLTDSERRAFQRNRERNRA